MHLLFLVPNAASNGITRAHALWLAACQLDHEVLLAAPLDQRIWRPMEGTDFARCIVSHGSTPQSLRDLALWADVIVAFKALARSFGLGLRCAEQYSRPILLDIDDPDLEVRTTTATGMLKTVFRAEVRRDGTLPQLRSMAAATRHVARSTSNPVLQERWGGTLVPHTGPRIPTRSYSQSTQPEVAFVGSMRRHKGVQDLRRAVRSLSDEGYRLVTTEPAHLNAPPWELSLGVLPYDTAMALQGSTDIIAVPSRDSPISRAQLPIKLVYAMLAGRAIVASRLDPLVWAVGDAGLLVQPGNVHALIDALWAFRDPARREALGRRAQARAEKMFSPEMVAPSLQTALGDAHARHNAR